MAESRMLTGGRDDLALDISRCLRMRYCDSVCRRCVDACPHGAVTLDGGLAVNPELCRGCLLCTSACPVGALEQSSDFSACLAKLSKVPGPILGCVRTAECSNATLPCLGGLSEEHLLALSHTMTGSVTLHLSLCGTCPNNTIVVMLKQRLEALSTAQLSGGSCRIEFAESGHTINYRDESVDRRSFFKSFRTALISSAAVIVSRNHQQTERRTEYSEKRVPFRRKLLNRTRGTLSHTLNRLLQEHFDSCITYAETCTRCQGCVAICPVGALKSESTEDTPMFEQLLCTGCGLCREFCQDDALEITCRESAEGNCQAA